MPLFTKMEKSLYENIIESLTLALLCVDRGLRLSAMNQWAEKLFETSRTFCTGKAVAQLFSKDRWFSTLLERTIKEGISFSDYEGRLHRRFSKPIPVAVSTMPLIDKDGSVAGVIALIKDMSGLKTLEDDPQRKERLAYMGTFVATLVHEIKNPLAGIRGSAQLLSKKLGDRKELLPYTGIIVKEADRLNSILRGLLDFARPHRLRKKKINVHKLLDDVILLLEGEGRGVTITKRYDPSLPPIKGDWEELVQVFINIIKNALEATPEGGNITVTTRMVTEFHLIERGSREAKFAEVEVADTGCGIPQKDIERIFNPFFTTKRGGSGLGLPVSYKIICEHGGFLRIESKPRAGTKAHIYLPTY